MHPYPNIPIGRPQPDAKRFIDVIMGRAASERPPMVEYLVDDALRKPIMQQLLGREWVDPQPGDRRSIQAYLDNFVVFFHQLGYDFVRYEESLPFAERGISGLDPTGIQGTREWRDMHTGAISDWASFDAYEWPSVTPATMANYAYLSQHLPEGMGLLVCHAGGIYEHLAAVFSYEGLCYALYDQPDLVEAVANRMGELMLDYYRQLVELEGVIAIFPGDDMGFRTGTLLPPDALRTYTLPWHKRYAELTHAHALPYFLHSCGNVFEIMDDLIEDVGIDAKHSYEDAIMPVEQFQERYGERIGILGGVDVDVLGRRSLEEIRSRVRQIIDTCQPRGRYCIGSGNSIPSYIPVESYLTMLDEAQR